MSDALPLAPRPHVDRPYRPLQGFVPAYTWGLKILLGRRWRLVLVALLAAFVGYLVGTHGVGQSRRFGLEPDPAYDLWKALDVSLLRFVIPLVALALVAPGFQREVSERTLVYHLVRPISRRTLFLARYLAGVTVAVPVGLIPMGTTLACAGLDLPSTVWTSLPLTVGLGVLATGAIYFLFAAWLRFGTIAGLVYTFVVDAFIQGASGSMQRLSATYYVRSVHHDLTDVAFAERSKAVAREIAKGKDMGVEDLLRGASPLHEAEPIGWLPWGEAVTVLVLVAAGLLALGLVIVSRRDYALKE